jgi:hypothetical protein
MLRRETDRLVEVAQGEEVEYSSEVAMRALTAANEFAEGEVVRVDDLSNTDDLEEVKDRVYSLLS